MSGSCYHEKTSWVSLEREGTPAKVMLCALCGTRLDYRPLRECDLATGPTEVLDKVAVETVKINGAESPGEPAAEEAAGQNEEVAASIANKRELVGGPGGMTEGGRCTKHGGEFPECDTGSGKAHHCTNSRWGGARSADGPCRCVSCHAWPKGMVTI